MQHYCQENLRLYWLLQPEETENQLDVQQGCNSGFVKEQICEMIYHSSHFNMLENVFLIWNENKEIINKILFFNKVTCEVTILCGLHLKKYMLP